MVDIKNKIILDVTCGNRSIWFQKKYPRALYLDIRKEKLFFDGTRKCFIEPDIIADFRELPFKDNTFKLVVFDPPHLDNLGENAILAKKYGRLLPGWEDDITQGINECIRVLKPDGILIFKWSESRIKIGRILKLIKYKPLFGHNTGSNSQTIWLTFIKD